MKVRLGKHKILLWTLVILITLSATVASLSHEKEDEHEGRWIVESKAGVPFDIEVREHIRGQWSNLSDTMVVFKRNAPVKKIEFSGLNMSKRGFVLRLEEVPQSSFNSHAYKRMYAIDPTSLEFEYAVVTAVAKGNQLFKCPTWNFTTQTCEVTRACSGDTKDDRVCNVTGGWEKIKDITPGQKYTFFITPDDPGFAEYSSAFTAPYCSTGESPCIANSSLLQCRDNVLDGNGPEPNEPNTIDSCTDGTATFSTPSCGGDESVENITITDYNNTYFKPGDTIGVEAWVYCWGATNDHLGLVYTNDSNAATPQWQLKEFREDGCPAAGYQRIAFNNFTLDNVEGNHSVRVYITYDAATPPPQNTCAVRSAGGRYDDNDDVAFIVQAGPTISNPQFNETVVNQSSPVRFNVTVIDPSGVDTAIATFRYPNATEVNRTLSKVYEWFWGNSTDLEPGEREVRAGLPPTDYSSKTCSDDWGFDCGTGPPETDGNNTFDACPTGTGLDDSVEEIYVNSTSVLPGDTIGVTCEFDPNYFQFWFWWISLDTYYIYYYNNTSWTQLATGGFPVGFADPGLVNRSSTFTAGSTVGSHWVRCIIDRNAENDQCANVGNWYDNDDVSLEVVNATGPDNEGSTPFVGYKYTSGQSYLNVTQIRIKTLVSYYDPSGSVTADNNDPDLEIGVYNGTGYTTGYYLNLNETYTGSGPNTTDANFTIIVNDQMILNAWKDPSNRMFEIRGVFLDTELGNSDAINWTGVWAEIQYENGTEYYYVWTDTTSAGTYNVTAVYANDTLGNLNSSSYTNVSFTVTAACSVAIGLSFPSIDWNIASLPSANQPAIGNNGSGVTGYNISVIASGCTADLYIRADGDLISGGGDVIGLGNETYRYNTTDSTVPGAAYTPLDTDYVGNQIGSNLGNGAYSYLKFFLSVPGGQAAGSYNNTIFIKGVKSGNPP